MGIALDHLRCRGVAFCASNSSTLPQDRSSRNIGGHIVRFKASKEPILITLGCFG
jgi:hypothetical protein